MIYRQDIVGPEGLHNRLNKERGKPSVCMECLTTDSDTRYEWAYVVPDPEEIESARGPYSLNLESYARMCASCHRYFDKGTRLRHKCADCGRLVTHW